MTIIKLNSVSVNSAANSLLSYGHADEL